MTTERGWSSVTMASLAERAGVSRQTVYNDIGTRSALAEAMVLDELQRFLALVDEAFAADPDDAVAATQNAVRSVLKYAESSELVRVIFDPLHEGRTELLPPLTTESSLLYSGAKVSLAKHLDPHLKHLSAAQREAVVDTVVRTTVSHVVQPSGTPRQTAAGLSWVVQLAVRL